VGAQTYACQASTLGSVEALGTAAPQTALSLTRCKPAGRIAQTEGVLLPAQVRRRMRARPQRSEAWRRRHRRAADGAVAYAMQACGPHCADGGGSPSWVGAQTYACQACTLGSVEAQAPPRRRRRCRLRDASLRAALRRRRGFSFGGGCADGFSGPSLRVAVPLADSRRPTL
jgi:hypothetical protein